MDVAMAIMEAQGVQTECIRAIDHPIAVGVWPDMTEHGWDRDDRPAIYEKVQAADILVLGTAIWLGEKTSVCTHVIERLYGNSHLLNDEGQYAYYGKVGGCLVTGNEDGAVQAPQRRAPGTIGAAPERRRGLHHGETNKRGPAPLERRPRMGRR